MFASKDALIANAGGGYPINNSLRFRSSASAYLNRTFSTPTNNKIWTYSIWVKRGVLGAEQELLNANTVNAQFSFLSGDTLYFYDGTSGASYITTQVFRDPSSWYHLLVAQDTTQATAGNRVKIYVNGVQITSFSTGIAPTQNNASAFNATSTIHNIGRYVNGGIIVNYFDGYMAEVNFIDGQALTPPSFGAYNSIGVWQPARYTGTYGTNGFYLKFASFGTTAALGTDSSGNGNTWTVNNISVTAGTTYDPMLDSPTLISATVANFAVINPLSSIAFPITNGNLSIGASTTSNRCTKSTFAVSSGKWYWEFKASSMSASGQIAGICSVDATFSGGVVATGYEVGYYSNNGNKYVNGTASAYGASWTTANTIGVALDVGAGTVTFYKDNVSQGSISITAGQTWVASWTGQNTTDGVDYTFGQRPFAYTPPTGFVALNAYNLPTPTIANGATVMAATTYTGTGATQSILNSNNTTTAVSFKPDMVWVKSRSLATSSNYLYDSTRGVLNSLTSNDTSAEQSVAQTLTSFNSNGFTLGTAGGALNGNGSTFIGWQWQAGQGSTSSNTAGSITSTVSVNATAGFSVVTYTGNGTAGATVGHSLGVTPAMVIIKSRSLTGSAPPSNWIVWHQSISQAIQTSTTIQLNTYTGAIYLNLTAASGTYGVDAQINGSGQTYVAYCWSAVAGYSAFGSYTGNGSTDGPFIYTGFRPRWIMVKNTADNTTSWSIWDTSRSTYNVVGDRLSAESSAAENTLAQFDFLSNGFKCRLNNSNNASGQSVIYAAFAENPFKYALAR